MAIYDKASAPPGNTKASSENQSKQQTFPGNYRAIIQRLKMHPQSMAHADGMLLQRMIGNQATGRLMAELGSINSSVQTVQRQALTEEEGVLQGKFDANIQRKEEPRGKIETVQLKGINSNRLRVVAQGNVAKAPSDFSADRYTDAGNSIHQVKVENFPAKAGTIVEGNTAGARVDKQGNTGSGEGFANIQVQANRDGDGNYPDLQYPPGTPREQKGTSIAEVHIDNRIVHCDKQDVRDRGNRLLKQALMNSRGERNTYPRKSYRVEIGE